MRAVWVLVWVAVVTFGVGSFLEVPEAHAQEAPDLVVTSNGDMFRGTIVIMEGDRVVVRLLDGSMRELSRAELSYAGPAATAPGYGVAAPAPSTEAREAPTPAAVPTPSAMEQLVDPSPSASSEALGPTHAYQTRPHWALAVPFGLMLAHAYLGGIVGAYLTNGTVDFEWSFVPLGGALVNGAVSGYVLSLASGIASASVQVLGLALAIVGTLMRREIRASSVSLSPGGFALTF